MGLTAKDGGGGGDFAPAPQGTHPATCMAVIDIGTQFSERYRKHQHKVLIGWELDTDERRDDGEAFVVWRRYTTSLHEKAALRKDLEAWRGRKFTDEELAGFDLRKILGKPCIVTITHKPRDGGGSYANVAGVAALPKRMAAPAKPGKLTLFDIDEPDMAVFAGFGEKLQEEIKASAEWREKSAERGGGPDDPPAWDDGAPPVDDDDIPF